jgi:DNA-binding Lrp family transcriptional regulator
MEKILALLRAHPAGMTSVELARALGWSRAAVGRTLRAMKMAVLIQGSGVHRGGAAVVQIRTRPLQLNIFLRKSSLARSRKGVA